jgi:hypothetical protein
MSEDMSEVTKTELESKFMIQHTRTQVTSWVKYIVLNDGSLKGEYSGRLRWDADDGYEMFWETVPPKMAERPEFEYILDSITQDREYRYVI